MDEKKKVVSLGEKRPTDHTPRELITFLGYVGGNPDAKTDATLTGDPRVKERWIDMRGEYAAQDCLVQVKIHRFSNEVDVLELLEKVMFQIKGDWPLMPPEGTPETNNVKSFSKKK